MWIHCETHTWHNKNIQNRYQFIEIDSDKDDDNEERDETDMFIESDVTKYCNR